MLSSSLLFVLSLVLFFPIVVFSELPETESIEEFKTHLGIMKMKILGPSNGIPIIAIHGMNLALVDEWYYVSKYLSTRGYKICMPNFHSNPNLKPKVLNPNDFSIILKDITKKFFNMDKIIIMGKSWGAQNTAIYGTTNNNLITKLILVAPGIPRGNQDIPLLLSKNNNPILLLWAEDDLIMSDNTIKIWNDAFNNNKLLTTYTVSTGGHVIFNEYAQPIEIFLKKK